eukprot:1179465-Prorocentrum_minimum.AAC.23
MQLLYPVVEHIICMGGHKRRESMIVMLLSVSHLRGWKPNSEFQGNVQQRLLYAKGSWRRDAMLSAEQYSSRAVYLLSREGVRKAAKPCHFRTLALVILDSMKES